MWTGSSFQNFRVSIGPHGTLEMKFMIENGPSYIALLRVSLHQHKPIIAKLEADFPKNRSENRLRLIKIIVPFFEAL